MPCPCVLGMSLLNLVPKPFKLTVGSSSFFFVKENLCYKKRGKGRLENTYSLKWTTKAIMPVKLSAGGL